MYNEKYTVILKSFRQYKDKTEVNQGHKKHNTGRYNNMLFTSKILKGKTNWSQKQNDVMSQLMLLCSELVQCIMRIKCF